MLSSLAVSLFLLFCVQSINPCPQTCSCSYNENGHWQVVCIKGDMRDPIPVLDIPPKTGILRVSAPENKTNSLTLGPIFRKLKNLEEINVVHSRVPALGEHSFWGLKKLLILNVSYNSITSLLPTNFRGPEFLQILDLSHNWIESVPSAVFRYANKLQALNMSHNRLPHLSSKIFLGLSKLNQLDLSFNPLGDLPSDPFIDVPLLEEFKCISCGLMKVSPALFKALKNLSSLDLSNNQLTSIPPLKPAFKLTSLKLNRNHIATIKDEDFLGLPLTDLFISHNRLWSIQEGVFRNSSLKTIDLSYNRIALLKFEIIEPILSRLKFLDFSGNSLHIKQLKKFLPQTRQLRKLGLAELGITQLPPDLLRRSRNLRFLNLSSNYLAKFPHELLYSVPHLQKLDLSGNNFRGLNQNVVSAFKAMSSLGSVRLERNPWHCEKCQVSYVMEWLRAATKQPHSASSCEIDQSSTLCLKCVAPSKYAGKPLVFMKNESLKECALTPSGLPTSEGTKENVQSDQPHLFARTNDFREDKSSFNKVRSFFKDHLAWLIGVGCGIILSLMLVILTTLACSKKQSANYFIGEDKENREKLVQKNADKPDSASGGQKTIDPTKVLPYEPMAILKVHARSPIYDGKLKETIGNLRVSRKQSSVTPTL